MRHLNEDRVSLSALGRLAGRRNLCYANASVQAFLGWTPMETVTTDLRSSVMTDSRRRRRRLMT